MKKVRFTETQILSILKQQEAGRTIKYPAPREHGVSEATVYNRKACKLVFTLQNNLPPAY